MAELSIPADETGSEAPTGAAEAAGEETPSGLGINQGFEVPDKFMNEDGTVNIESMAKSYAELEKNQSVPKQDSPETPTEVEDQPFSTEDLAAMRSEMETEGKLSEKTFEILKLRGMPRHMAESYIEGQTLIATQATEKIMAPVGGEEGYNDLMTWAGENLQPGEIEAYDKIMFGMDMNQKMLAIEGLAARRDRENPSSPNLIMGDTAAAPASSSFGSWDQVKRAMRDPRYETDESYRETVTQRLAMSDI
jgi:hypothetical protein